MQDPQQHRIGIGIDFGTSNSAAAIYDGVNVKMVSLESNSLIMPSASYINREFVTSTGLEAIENYISDNQGRKVEFSLEVLGEARTSTGQIDQQSQLPGSADTQLVYGQAFNDGSLPGRLFRGSKRLLGSKENNRIMVFNRPFRLVAIITPILLRIRNTIQALILKNYKDQVLNDYGEEACIGHPVNFEGRDENHNRIALDRLAESYRHAGVKRQTFYPEPTAAALSYIENNKHVAAKTMLIVDFGGGTLDLCVLRRKQIHFDVIAIHGIGLGGDHIDQAMFKKILFPLLGKGERWQREVDGKHVDTLFPFDDYEDLLLNWTVSYMLNQNQYTTPVLDKIKQNDDSREKFERLYELITQNYSYQIFQALKKCKAELSEHQSTILDIPEIDIEETIQREDFEIIIADLLLTFEMAVNETIIKAGLQENEIDLVLRTGGSSLIPSVRDILERKFPDKVVEHDPFTSVAAGLALADYFQYGESRN